jgi:hypothetical protein
VFIDNDHVYGSHQGVIHEAPLFYVEIQTGFRMSAQLKGGSQCGE